jgi:hypothetical protein
MTSSQLAEETVQVALISSGNHANLAIGHLSRHFGLRITEAEALLARGCGVIAPEMSRAAAGAAIPVLTALGLQIALVPKNAEPVVERFDLSIRLQEAAAIDLVRPTLKRHGWGYEVAPEDFRGPAGLEITGLTRAKAEDFCAALRSLRGVGVTPCPQSGAAYDVFAPTSGLGSDMAQILRYISVLACSAKDHCPPLAVDLDRRMLASLLARFPKAGLIGVNQAFQRFHLTLTGTGRLSGREVADFLATRGRSLVETTEVVSARRGLRLECGLTRAAARQFVADYAMIGMTVRADLVHG